MTLLLLFACVKPAETGWTAGAALDPVFAQLDTDHDGEIGAEEWRRAAPEGPPIARADPNGDGVVSRDELAAWIAAFDPTQVDQGQPRRVPDATAAKITYPRSWEERMRADRDAFAKELTDAGAASPWPATPPPVITP